jgi:hypothetical protein
MKFRALDEVSEEYFAFRSNQQMITASIGRTNRIGRYE